MEETISHRRAKVEFGLDEDLNEISFTKVKQKFEEWLYLEDYVVLDAIFSTLLANRLPSDPVWLFLISSPGAGKSEILRALGSVDDVYTLSSLTENTLISGYKCKTDPSLIPKLDGKVLVIKDFTAVLSIHRESRTKIIGDLRDAYDGECSKTFGTGEKKSYKSKFGLIAGVTPVIDKHWGIQADLGERFLRLRIRLQGRERIVERATANIAKEKEMRAELSTISKSFLSSCSVPAIGDITIERNIDSKIMQLASLLAWARSRVSRDGKDSTICYEPEPEVGTRIAKQLKSLAIGYVSIHKTNSIDQNAYELVRRTCRDTLPSREAKILETLYIMQGTDNMAIPTSEIGDRSGFPTETCKKVLEDFRVLKIVEREGKGTFKWHMKEEFWDLCQTTGLFIPF